MTTTRQEIDEADRIFITLFRASSTEMASLIVADSCLLCDAGLCCLLLLLMLTRMWRVKKRMSCRDLIPWVVGHCECSFGPLRRSVCRCCGSSASVFFSILKRRVCGL